MTAVKFGISFTTRFLNQGNALVNVHRDGTVQVSTGAVEMGQGVNSRIASIVAQQFGLPVSSVRMMPTSTEKNANTSPTAASTGTDINGAAAAKACESICSRLAGLAIQLRSIPAELWATKTAGLGTMPEIIVGDGVGPNGTDDQRVEFTGGHVTVTDRSGAVFAIGFAELIRDAYRNRISLSDYGYYTTPNLGFDKVQGKGNAFLYFAQGVAASEVELDPDTGEVKVRRVDILMDLGRPVNHALDMGQVMGGFIQGMGWVTTEHLVYDINGKLLSHSPSTYKIPNVQDTPRVFNADLIFNEGNTQNIRGSKASGEPPLLLSLSVWTAIRDAIMSARTHSTTEEVQLVPLAIPATAERVLRGLSPESFAIWDAQEASGVH
jgi:xanthine dehydrogenase large subunit